MQNPRQAFIAAQVDSLAPLDFVVVTVIRPPYDAVQVRREDDGHLALAIAPRAEDEQPFTPEQVTALARLGFPASSTEWAGATPPADGAAAADLVEHVLTEVFAARDGEQVDVRHGSLRAERDAARRLAELRARIEPVLASLLGDPAPVDDDGDYVVDLDGSRVFVAPRAVPGAPSIVRVFSITNGGVTMTPDLGLFLSRLNFSLMFGRFSVDAEHQAVWFDETLLGEHITDDELRFTVQMVASTATEWDQRIAAMFGGRVRERPPQGDAPPPKPGQGGYL